MSTILLATDGTSASAAAVAHAIGAAHQADATLHVVVVRPRVFFGPGGPVAVTRLHEVPAVRDVAEEAAQQARDAGVRACAHDIEGDDAAAIVALADELGATLIVVGHEPGDARPSVSSAIAAAATTPVAVVSPAIAGRPG